MDVATVGLEDILDGAGTVMIEWPERIRPLLPPDHLWIALTYLSDTRRTLRLQGDGERAAELLKQFKKSAFGV
jgi:tRNA threonylcarbamoyladenosine biosynthesis protein TsaE